MTAVIQWGSLQYPETQVLEYAPYFEGERVGKFERISGKPLQYLTAIPLKGYRVKLMFSSYLDARNTANAALSKYEELETRYRDGITAALTVAGVAAGNYIITGIDGKFPYCAETGKPYIVECDVSWREDVAV